jgi:hypothetical protein
MGVESISLGKLVSHSTKHVVYLFVMGELVGLKTRFL